MTTTYPLVYLKGGSVSHLLELRQRAVRYALCQRSSDCWLGLASELHRQRAQSLPLCELCQERAELAGER